MKFRKILLEYPLFRLYLCLNGEYLFPKLSIHELVELDQNFIKPNIYFFHFSSRKLNRKTSVYHHGQLQPADILNRDCGGIGGSFLRKFPQPNQKKKMSCLNKKKIISVLSILIRLRFNNETSPNDLTLVHVLLKKNDMKQIS